MLDLLPFCTNDGQRKLVQKIHETGSITAAAKSLSRDLRNTFRVLSRLKANAARQGHSPEHDMIHTVPDGFIAKGISTYYNSDGKPTGQWVKSSIHQERQAEIMREAITALCEEIAPLPIILSPRSVAEELCNVYTLTDCHVGMKAWSQENLEADWDLTIAEETLSNAFMAMLKAAPDAAVCVVAQLGDWMHWDGMEAVTPAHRHLLDADGRFGKVVKVSIRLMRRVIDAALAKHKQVVLLIAEGNHDLASSIWMRNMFAALYGRNRRLTVIDSEMPYYVYQHGKTMLAWHHGHLKKNEALPLLMAAQFPRLWGNTVKRYVHVGHRHHLDIKEYSGITVVQHSTLSARDAYAARGGWMSERQARAITYHREYGEVAQVIVTPEMCRKILTDK
jgi:hypothetical protein